MSPIQPLKVLFIAGSGRCGSTLVARLLGELDGYCNVGEASRFLFHLEMQQEELPCSCGKQPTACSYWSDLLSEIPPDIQQFVTTYIRIRNMPWLSHPLLPSGLRSKLGTASTSLLSVLKSIEARENRAVIVDASKNPATGLLLSSIPDVDLTVLHLVRDPRAVVTSWSAPKGYLQSHSLPRVAAWWNAYNIGSEFLGARGRRYLRLRYEDFVKEPEQCITKLAVAVTGRTPDTGFFFRDGAVLGNAQHALAGNPEKFSNGNVKIEYRPWDLSIGRRAAVTAMCFPLMARYGYLKN